MNFFDASKNQNIPEILPIVPTVDVVVFPHMIVPLLIVDPKIIAGVKQAIDSGNRLVLILACKKNSASSIGTGDLYSVGTVANIIRLIPLEDGNTKVLVQGVFRAKVTEVSVNEILSSKIEVFNYEKITESAEFQEKILFIKCLAENLVKNGSFNSDFSNLLSKITSPEKIADFILSHLTLSVEEFQKLLEAKDYLEFMDLASEFLAREGEFSKLQQKVKLKVREYMNNSQREFYVKEQIKALREEIGDSSNEEIEVFKEKLIEFESFFSEEVYKEISKSITRLEGMSQESAEANVLKNYLELVFSLPWDSSTEDNLNIKDVKRILDEEHYGLKSAKERILDFLSIQYLSKNYIQPIICFYGPPGTGKTSLANSIAKALGRKNFRVSVGGMKDEAEIRGHRRTYVGAIPGRFIKGIKQVQSKNPLIIIDEIDKIAKDFKGDPSSALLEVLDHQQNSSFYDYYLGIPFDLSKSFFIATANDISSIPLPLRDRMELIEVPAYTFEEKFEIAKNYLVKKSIKSCGLEDKEVNLSDEILSMIILNYTLEAGVRDLDRCIKRLFSKLARVFVEKGEIPDLTKESLEDYLGAPKYLDDCIKNEDSVGIVNGLCWTSVGGGVLQIETVLLNGKGKFILTGQLGDVMKESAQTAFSFLKSNFEKFEIEKNKFEDFDVHIHIPAGAIPKDGPSAGVTLLIAMYSVFKDLKVNSNFAMTGEIDLYGNVLPVGGIKEKVLAARRNGIKNVFIPLKNKSDCLEVGEILEDMNIYYVSNINEIIELVFDKKIENSEEESFLEEVVNNLVGEEEFSI